MENNIIYPEAYHRNIASPERILCAAIWYFDNKKKHPHQPKNIDYGYVWCGRRHHNIINLRASLLNKSSHGDLIQGFLTTKDRFVNRIDAGKIAIEQKQAFDLELGDELISEDLY